MICVRLRQELPVPYALLQIAPSTGLKENGLTHAIEGGMRTSISILLLTLTAATATILFAQQPGAKDDIKDAGKDIKDAGKSTGKAAKKTGRAVKKTTKKAVNKSADKVEEGADKVKSKTQ
jgi:hypothetical protein